MKLAVLPIVLCLACTCGCKRRHDAEAGESHAAMWRSAEVTASEARDRERTPSTAPVVTGGGNVVGTPASADPIHARAEARFPAVLRSEKPLLERGGLSVARVAEVIRSPAFNELLSELEDEVASDPLAQDVTALQRRQWAQWMEGQATLHAFACGLSLCIGTVRTGADASGYALAARRFVEHGPPGSSLGEHRVDLGNGVYEHRFVMTHDPALGGVLHRWPPHH